MLSLSILSRNTPAMLGNKNIRLVSEKGAKPMIVRNQWYVAAWPREIGRSLLARTIANEHLVMYRREDGTAVALQDRCWHRSAPLSRGKLVGDMVECGYHGLHFNSEGACTRMPNPGAIPAAACVPAFPLVERHGFAWVWIGEAARADADLIPDMHQNDDPAFVGEGGILHVKADYRLLIDNLMDLSHESYVHPTTIGHEALSAAPIETKSDRHAVTVKRWTLDIDPPPFWKNAIKSDKHCDRWQLIKFMPPAAIAIDVGVAIAGTGAPEGDRSQGITGFVINALTPETDKTTHYFWNFVRDYEKDDPALTKALSDGTKHIFGQDVVMLEAQQARLDAYPDAVLRNLTIDSGGARARRLIEALHSGSPDARAAAAE